MFPSYTIIIKSHESSSGNSNGDLAFESKE